jgi:hypothetical protein
MVKITFPGLSSSEPLEADYTDWEREQVRRLGQNPETVREVRLIHELKARLDARIVEQVTPVPRGMFACGHNDPWVSTGGRTLCAVCHPPAAPHLVDQERTRLLVRGPLAVPDVAASRAAKEEGIKRVDKGADPEWKERAIEAWRAVCLAQPIFTPDDVWTRVEKPREPRALGPVALLAVKLGYCEPTGRVVKSKLPVHHQAPITEYRSLLFGQPTKEEGDGHRDQDGE